MGQMLDQLGKHGAAGVHTAFLPLPIRCFQTPFSGVFHPHFRFEVRVSGCFDRINASIHKALRATQILRRLYPVGRNRINPFSSRSILV
jgi:hypothetical protein